VRRPLVGKKRRRRPLGFQRLLKLLHRLAPLYFYC
jgi:hypothetical protein